MLGLLENCQVQITEANSSNCAVMAYAREKIEILEVSQDWMDENILSNTCLENCYIEKR